MVEDDEYRPKAVPGPLQDGRDKAFPSRYGGELSALLLKERHQAGVLFGGCDKFL
jgi:hypothetical protein